MALFYSLTRIKSRGNIVQKRTAFFEPLPDWESQDTLQLEVSILKSVEEDGETILCTIDDEQELETVYGLIMDSLYEEDTE